MTTGSESWTGTDGASWGSNWFDDDPAAGTGNATIQSNFGQQTTDSAFGSFYRSGQSWSADGGSTRKTWTDLEVLVDVRYTSTAVPYSEITLRGDSWFANYDEPNNGWVVSINFPSNQFNIVQMQAGGENGRASAAFSYSQNTWYRVRARISGSGANTLIQGRVWAVGGSEPGTWTVSYTDTGNTGIASGFFALSNSTSGASAVTQWDNLSWDDLAPAAPKSLPPLVRPRRHLIGR